MHLAAEKGKIIRLRPFLASGNLDSLDHRGKTPLWLAGFNGHLGTVNTLLKAKAGVDARTSKQETALMAAAHEGHLDVVNALISFDADVSATDSKNESALLYACTTSRPDHRIIASLLEAKAEPQNSSCSYLPLVSAIMHPTLESLKSLIDAKASVNGQPGSIIPLAAAIIAQRVDAAKLLIEANADVNAGETLSDTSLYAAIASGSVEMTQFLISNGVDLSRRSETGFSYLHVAVQNHADPSSDDNDDDDTNSSMQACLNKPRDHIGVLKALIEAGVDINVQDDRGNTPLMIASHANKADMVKLLAGKTANDALSVRNKDCVSALGFAVLAGSVETAKALIDAKADVNLSQESVDATP